MVSRTLTTRLAELRETASPQQVALYDSLVRLLIDSGSVAHALKEGDRFPDFMLVNAEGRFVRLPDLLAAGPVVFSFYRGGWCPYCSAELMALSEVSSLVKASGAQLVAITPEAGGRALRKKFELELDFEILCDLDNTLALECGLVYPVPDGIRSVFLSRGIDLEAAHGNDAWLLPTPATYVTGTDGVIMKAFVDADFRFRLDPVDIVAALQA